MPATYAADVPAVPPATRDGGLELVNRVVVSPMDQYVAVDGHPGDFHLVHLGGKALGGAGLVMTEMVCVSPTGRITPGCTGLWNDEQQAAWRRVTDFVHTHTSAAKIGLQLGHSGRKGSTKLMWEGIDEPLDRRQLGGRRAVPGGLPPRRQPGAARARPGRRWTSSATSSSTSARRGAEAGFDLLELHCAHGYLLSAFLSPFTNRRTDDYGGSVVNRLRYPVGGVRRDARGLARLAADDRADLRDRLDRRRQRPSTTRSRSPRRSRRPVPPRSTCRPAR